MTNCPNCGFGLQESSPNPARRAREELLNSGLVRCLIKAVMVVHKKNENKFHLQRDLELTKTEYNNFQKLRYHGLIHHADRENPKSGEWLITKRGGEFLRGEISVPRRVTVQDNKIVEHNLKDLVHINQLKHKYPEFSPIYAYAPCIMPAIINQKLF